MSQNIFNRILFPPTVRIRRCQRFSQLPFSKIFGPTSTTCTWELGPVSLLAHAGNPSSCPLSETGGGTPSPMVHPRHIWPSATSPQAHFAAFPTPHTRNTILHSLPIINNLPRPQPRSHGDPFLSSPSWRQRNPFEMSSASDASKSRSPRDHHCISSPPPRATSPTQIKHLPHLSVRRTPSLCIRLPGKR